MVPGRGRSLRPRNPLPAAARRSARVRSSRPTTPGTATCPAIPSTRARMPTSPRSARASTCTPTSAPTPATGCPTSSFPPRSPSSPWRSQKPPNPIRVPIPFQRTRPWRRDPIATCWPCRRAPAVCTSCSRRASPAGPGTRTRAPSSTFARTRCGRTAGRPPTRPACPFCPGWFATTRCRRARSATPCASPWSRLSRPTFIPPPTTRPAPRTRTCPRWGCACA